MSSDIVELYTDGACKGNPGRGGWGVYAKINNEEKEFFGGHERTTNNRMELTAVIKAIKFFKNSKFLRIYTDSKYVQNGINDWIENWKLNGWRTSSKKPVANQDLWMELDQIKNSKIIEWRWVKGHSGNPGNEKADFLANKGVVSIQR